MLQEWQSLQKGDEDGQEAVEGGHEESKKGGQKEGKTMELNQ